MSTEKRIYVASLSDYNNGVLHGAWFDLEDYYDADELMTAVTQQVLRTSRFPNVMAECLHCEGLGVIQRVEAGIDSLQVRRLGLPRIVHTETCPHCSGRGEVPSAEEWAIHDFEGLPDRLVSEYTPFGELYDYLETLNELEDRYGSDAESILEAFVELYGDGDHVTARTIEDAYIGEYDSGAAFAEELAVETGVVSGDQPFFAYIDWDRVWECEYSSACGEQDGYFFWGDWK